MRAILDVHRSMMRYAARSLGPEWEVRPWGVEGEFKFPFARVAIVAPPDTTGPAHTNDITMTVAVHAYPTPGENPEASWFEAERVRQLLHDSIFRGYEYVDPLIPPAYVAASAFPFGGVLPVGSYHYGLTAVAPSGESVASMDVPVVTARVGSVRLLWGPVAGARSYRVYRGSAAGNRGLMAEVMDPGFDDDGLVVPGVTLPPVSSAATSKVRSANKRIPLYDYADVPLDGPEAFSNVRHPSDYFRVLSCTIDHGVDPEDDTQFRVIAQARVTWRRTGYVSSGHKIVTEVRLQSDPVS